MQLTFYFIEQQDVRTSLCSDLGENHLCIIHRIES